MIEYPAVARPADIHCGMSASLQPDDKWVSMGVSALPSTGLRLISNLHSFKKKALTDVSKDEGVHHMDTPETPAVLQISVPRCACICRSGTRMFLPERQYRDASLAYPLLEGI